MTTIDYKDFDDQEKGLPSLDPIDAVCLAATALVDPIRSLVLRCDRGFKRLAHAVRRLDVDLVRLERYLDNGSAWPALCNANPHPVNVAGIPAENYCDGVFQWGSRVQGAIRYEAICGDVRRSDSEVELDWSEIAEWLKEYRPVDTFEIALQIKKECQRATELTVKGKTEQATGDDGYVMAHKLYDIDSRVTNFEEMLAFLKRHPEIPNHSNGRRRMVHAGKFVNAIKGPTAFDYLDDAEPASVFGDADFIEGAAERLAETRKRKKAEK